MSSGAAEAVARAIDWTSTPEALGEALVRALTGRIAFERLNIGLLDVDRYEFLDAFVHGRNVPGRSTGHRRTLKGSVVEAAMRAGEGFAFGSTDRTEWTSRFPGFGPVYDSGIRAMLAVTIRDDERPMAALVLASTDPCAYGDDLVAEAIGIGRLLGPRVVGLRR